VPWLITKYPVVGDVTKLDILYMNMCHGPSQNIKPWLITKYPAVGDVAKLDRLYMYMLPWLITKYPVVGHVAKLDIQDVAITYKAFYITYQYFHRVMEECLLPTYY